MEVKTKIPVIIITGFLGAGKTTFINEIIRAHQHLKLALVENEFGEKSIDQDLIIGMRSENIFDLSNGCICCSISNEFSLALLELAEKAGEIDYLLIETTGIADLSNVIKPFYADEELKKRFTLAGSICVVDAANYEQQLNAGEQQMQVILSDELIINKCSEISSTELPSIKKVLNSFNSTANISTCDFGKLETFKLETFSDQVNSELERKLSTPFQFRLVNSKKYSTFTHEFSGTINLKRFQYWFNYFAAINQLQIYRVKGILHADGLSHKTIVQSVGGAVSYSEGSFIDPTNDKTNRLVFIGREIDFERIVYELNSYLSEDDAP
ncbi:CobW family GTP-binding protein [Sunxiuqinia sp. A32]|uniref:CobW family GTP-binding protein n=1 Tax=Sunxiuqinia sp. A32 TaxID=3461496 RepID=UPI0040456EB8